MLTKKFFVNLKKHGLGKTLSMVWVFVRGKRGQNKKRQFKELAKAIKQHNEAYAKISRLVVKLGNGIHPKHRIMDYHKFFVDNVSLQDTILDFGCGNGYLTYDVAKKAKHVMGIDFDPKHIAICQERFSRENIDYIVGDATTYSFNQKFDKIILSNVLEHIKDRVNLLTKLTQLANTILLRVPMISRDWLVAYKKEMGFEYRLDHTHETEFTLEQIEDEVSQAGWEIEKYQVNWGEFWGILKRI